MCFSCNGLYLEHIHRANDEDQIYSTPRQRRDWPLFPDKPFSPSRVVFIWRRTLSLFMVESIILFASRCHFVPFIRECFIRTHQTFIKSPCTCLLYTSPSPRDGLLSRMPSSA
eukprot:TRINITY_DN3499_c0_g5_i3.p3 TRINITY_DN3499_c0_g5~~TRINITY_DN3499_c0_g5_i3.p3  ORF type:complete len:113 (-),score=7.58 TRINITY_DN3499_c0_g5_i3:26-364(-)